MVSSVPLSQPTWETVKLEEVQKDNQHEFLSVWEMNEVAAIVMKVKHERMAPIERVFSNETKQLFPQ